MKSGQKLKGGCNIWNNDKHALRGCCFSSELISNLLPRNLIYLETLEIQNLSGEAYWPSSHPKSRPYLLRCTHLNNPIFFVENAHYYQWGEWGQCSKSCGTGSQSRSRSCNSTVPLACAHEGPAVETQECYIAYCSNGMLKVIYVPMSIIYNNTCLWYNALNNFASSI